MEQIGERGKTLCEICKCAWFKPGFYMIRHLTVCERKLNLNRVAEEFTDLFEETAVLDGNSISSNTLDTEIEGDLANNNFFDEDYSSVPSTRTTCACCDECRIIISVFKLDDKSHTVSWACTVYIARTGIVL